jgi:hypothetical protein
MPSKLQRKSANCHLSSSHRQLFTQATPALTAEDDTGSRRTKPVRK